MSNLSVFPTLPTAAIPTTGSRDPAKVHDAAQQFEALLMGQILRSVRQSGAGWLGSGEDSSAECATDFAEQQFAAVLSQQGGLGLATLISSGLTAGDSK
jgi:flagellar protein FlgJ